MTLPDRPFPIDPILLPRRRFVSPSDPAQPLSEEELQAFLEDTSDLQETIDLWDRLSGLPGLLDTKIQTEVQQQARALAEIFFDEETGVWRYLVSGRRVPERRIRLGVSRVANSMQVDMRELTARMVSGEISREQWYTSMRWMMKNEYRASYLAAIGGKANYTRSEVSRFGWTMRPHYRWLNNFLEELETGKQPLNGFAVMRAGMYARAGNAVYQNTRLRVAERNGFRLARRVLGPNESHCTDSGSRPGCIELAARGWVPINEAVELGEATCLSNCLCSLEFRKR